MKELTEQEIILEHALENENNLKLAMDIHAAYPDLRRRIILTFLEKLDRFVRRQLDESQWNLKSELHDRPFDQFAGFFGAKKAWAERYQVMLSADKSDARKMIIGVAKQAKSLPPIEGLKQELDTKIRPASASPPWWDWHHRLEDPYGDWGNKDALIKMYDGTAVEAIGEYFLRIASVAVPVIDKHILAMST